jgi:SAM-dependent methyltransferase
MVTQSIVDAANREFWDELCGSEAARLLDVTGSDRASLRRFDDWYFEFYPYLGRYIGFESLRDRDVLEVGLGYGTVGQKIAESGARYVGLDIAKAPVNALNRRLAQGGLNGRAIQGSILHPPFDAEGFDVVIAIGCYHHTGNLPLAIANTAKLLRPKGRAVIMIYNAGSYVRIIVDPIRAISHIARGSVESVGEELRSRFDKNKDGQAAPETVLVSRNTFRKLLLKHFRVVSVRMENAIAHRPFSFIPRSVMCATVGKVAGLDLYAVVTK